MGITTHTHHKDSNAGEENLGNTKKFYKETALYICIYSHHKYDCHLMHLMKSALLPLIFSGLLLAVWVP